MHKNTLNRNAESLDSAKKLHRTSSVRHSTNRQTRRLLGSGMEALEKRVLMASDFWMLDDHDPSVVLEGKNIITVDEDARSHRGAEWDDYQLLRQGNGDSNVTYVFDDLSDGTYEVFASWVHYADRGTNVPYSIFDGDTMVDTVRINQQIPASDTTFDHEGWDTPFASLGQFAISSGVLTVRMSNDTNGWSGTNVIALKKIADTPAEPVLDVDGNTTIIEATADITPFAATDAAFQDFDTKDTLVDDAVSQLESAMSYPENTAGWIAHLRRLEDRLQEGIDDGSVQLNGHQSSLQESRMQLERSAIGKPRVAVSVEGDTQHITYWNPLDQSHFIFYWHGGSEEMTVNHPGGANGKTLSYDFGPQWPGRNYSTHINMYRDAEQTNGRIASIPGGVKRPGEMHAYVENIGIYWVPIDPPEDELLKTQSDAALQALEGATVNAVFAEENENASTEPVIHEVWTRGDTMHIRYSNPSEKTKFVFNVAERPVHEEVIEHANGMEQGYIWYSFADFMEGNETARLDATMYDVSDDDTETVTGIVTGLCIEGGITAQVENPDFLESGMTILSVRGTNISVLTKTPFAQNVLEVEGGGYLALQRFAGNGMDDLQAHVVTFNADNPSGRYKLSLTDFATGRQAAGAMFVWNKATGTLTEETTSMVLGDAIVEKMRTDLGVANYQAMMQSSVESMELNITAVRRRQGWDMFRESKFFMDDTDDMMYIEQSRVAGMPDAGNIFRQLVGGYQEVIGTLLQSAAKIAVAGWSGQSQKEAEEVFQRHYNELSGNRYIAEFAIDFGVKLPSAAEIRDEGIRLAIVQVDRLYENQVDQKREYAQASKQADGNRGQSSEGSQETERLVGSDRVVRSSGFDVVDVEGQQLVFGEEIRKYLEEQQNDNGNPSVMDGIEERVLGMWNMWTYPLPQREEAVESFQRSLDFIDSLINSTQLRFETENLGPVRGKLVAMELATLMATRLAIEELIFVVDKITVGDVTTTIIYPPKNVTSFITTTHIKSLLRESEIQHIVQDAYVRVESWIKSLLP